MTALATRLSLSLALALPALAAHPPAWGQATAAPSRVAARLTDAEFWKVSRDLSEPDGFFRSENFISNEGTFQTAIPELLRVTRPGGAYLGVGPEQNFSYIAAIQPSIALIVDIRRGNLHEILLYKALFELSADRAEFLSRLFSRPRPASVRATATVDSLFAAFGSVRADSALFRRNRAAVRELLVIRHALPLSADDIAGIDYVYDVFYRAGPQLDYMYPRSQNNSVPNYASLMTGHDGTGAKRSFLASDELFRRVKDLQTRNLIVPVVGDFGGPKTIRAIGSYLRSRNVGVSAIYASNVEQYLFGQGDAWRRYYDSVATLPLDSGAMFIRSNRTNVGFAAGGRGVGGGMQHPSMMSSIREQLAAYHDGRIRSWNDVVRLSH